MNTFNRHKIIDLIDSKIENINNLQSSIDKENNDNRILAIDKREAFVKKASQHMDAYNEYCIKEFFNCNFWELNFRRGYVLERYKFLNLPKKFNAKELSCIKTVVFSQEDNRFIYDDTIRDSYGRINYTFHEYLENVHDIEWYNASYSKKRFAKYSSDDREYHNPIEYLNMLKDYFYLFNYIEISSNEIIEKYIKDIIHIDKNFRYDEVQI